MAAQMQDGQRYWDQHLDANFSPRADPKRVGDASMDMMARRIYMSFMAELDEPHMMNSDYGWELDPTDNWNTPHTTRGHTDPRLGVHVGTPRPTRRKKKVRKQHEEATRHAASNVAHHEFSHADHYMAMRADLVKAIKKHVGEGGTTMEGLEDFIRTQLTSHMTDRQKRRALETVVSERLAKTLPKYVTHLNSEKTIAMIGLAAPQTLLGGSGSDSEVAELRAASRKSLEGLAEHLKQPIMGADGEPVLITDDIATFLNSHPMFTGSVVENLLDLDPTELHGTSDRDAALGEEAKVGDLLTRQHLLNVFGSEHAHRNAHGNAFAGDDISGGPQRTPLWAVDLDPTRSTGKYGGSYTQPLSGRSLITVSQHQFAVVGGVPTSAPVNDFIYTPDAFEIMLEHGTPEIQMHGLVAHPDGTHTEMLMQEGAIIPALDPDSTRILIDALTRSVGQIDRSWYKETLIRGDIPGKTLADMPSDKKPKLGKGRDVLPFLDEDLPADEVSGALDELVEHWMDKLTQDARHATGDQRDIGLKNISSYLEHVGRSAFHFDDLGEAEIDGIMDLIEDIGFEYELANGRIIKWAPYMGWIDQRPYRQAGMMPLVNGMSARHHEFFAELGAALTSGLSIRPPINSTQHGALKKLTAWLRRNQPFTAKVNIDEGRATRIHLARDELLRREELLRQSPQLERLARNTTKQEPYG